jgi:hypothetical protein
MPLGRPRDLVAAIFDDAGLMASVVGEATDHRVTCGPRCFGEDAEGEAHGTAGGAAG